MHGILCEPIKANCDAMSRSENAFVGKLQSNNGLRCRSGCINLSLFHVKGPYTLNQQQSARLQPHTSTIFQLPIALGVWAEAQALYKLVGVRISYLGCGWIALNMCRLVRLVFYGFFTVSASISLLFAIVQLLPGLANKPTAMPVQESLQVKLLLAHGTLERSLCT